MKDEIKEILDDLRKYANEGGEHKLMEYEIKHIQCYITNLQEELKSANESITWWQNRFNAVGKENERLKQTQYIWSYDLDMQLEDYKSRNEKYKKVINEIKEKIDDYFGYDYKNESQARLDTINEINHIIVDLYNGGDEE